MSIYISTDDSISFEFLAGYPWNEADDVEGSCFAIDMVGIIHAVGVEIPPDDSWNYGCRLYYSQTMDEGITWNPESPVDPLEYRTLVSGNYVNTVIDDARAGVAPFIAINPFHNPLIIYFNNSSEYKLLRTYDHGTTWEEPVTIVLS